MQDVSEIVRVRDGLVKELWDTVATDSGTEHTELLARIDTLNWVLESGETPQTVEGPAMTLADLVREDDLRPDQQNPDDEPPVAARSTLADTDGPDQSPTLSTWDGITAAIKRGTDRIIHSTGHLTPTEIISIAPKPLAADDGVQRMSPPYSVRREDR